MLRFWADENRQKAVADYLVGETGSISFDSLRKWQGSFSAWTKFRKTAIEHVRRGETEFWPLRSGAEAIFGQAEHVNYCVQIARTEWERRSRYQEWQTFVEHTIEAVENRAREVVSLDERMARDASERSMNRDEIRSALLALAAVGHRLKEVFSARGYFNFTGSE